MTPTDAMRLLAEDLNLGGDRSAASRPSSPRGWSPRPSGSTENLHRGFIDHAEYPISAEIEQRCVRMLRWRRQTHDRARGRRAALDESPIGVAAVLGTTFTGHMDDITGFNQLLLEQLPWVAFRLAGDHASYDESDVAWQLSAERGWMVPAYTPSTPNG